jgi:putative membrane protein
MGVYTYMTGILKRLPQLDVSVADGVAVVVFTLGCGIGLVSFSKLLRWLLANDQAQTMAILCGFMVGALRKIWPFQRDLSPPGVTELKHKVFENYLPESFSADVAACCAVAVVAMAAVFAIDWLTRSQKPDQTANDGAA